MAKKLYEIVLRPEGHPDGPRVVEMMEMGTAEIFTADKTLPRGAGDMETKVEYLRYCLVKDGDQTINYVMLQGPKAWDDRFSMSETISLCFIWNQIHEPSASEVEAIQGGAWRAKSGR